jgi:TetR/AcrR family transcriptional regulator, transcriptional repressor for nem operon
MGSGPSGEAASVRRRGPGSRADLHHPTRHELLDSAMHIAERDGIAALTVSSVTTHASLAKGTFYIHFTDRTALVLEIHARFHDELFAAILLATDSVEPGRQRAADRLIAFLDGCRNQRGVRSLLVEAGGQPELRNEARRRNEQAARVIAADLRLAGPNPFALDSARLIVAATADTAARELDANRKLPRLRSALVALVR